MPILPNPSVSPLHSFASRPDLPRPVGFSTMVREVWSWWSGKRRPVPLRRQIAEAQAVERLSIELAEAAEPPAAPPKAKGKSSKI